MILGATPFTIIFQYRSTSLSGIIILGEKACLGGGGGGAFYTNYWVKPFLRRSLPPSNFPRTVVVIL